MVARLQNDSSTGSDDGSMGVLQSCKALFSSSRKTSSPNVAKISGIDFLYFWRMIVSVSRKRNPQRRAISLPTEDFPDPMKPTKTRLRADPGRCIAATASTQSAATGNEINFQAQCVV